jgi:hypothetical protein
MGAVIVTRPLSTRAQQPATAVIGFLNNLSPAAIAHPLAAFREGLKEAGYIENHNLAIEYRWAESHNNRLPELAADLVRRQVAVIVATGGWSLGARCQGCNYYDPDRLFLRHRSCRAGPRCQPEPAWRQRHRRSCDDQFS